MAKPDDESCAVCRYYQPDEKLAGVFGERTGWCLRFPPHVGYIDQDTSRTLSRFATTMDIWWCGEFQKPSGPPPAIPSTGVSHMATVRLPPGGSVNVVAIDPSLKPEHPIALPPWGEVPVDPGYGYPEKPVDPEYGIPVDLPHPDHTLPGDLPHPEHPIVIVPPPPPDGAHPEHPIALPPDFPPTTPDGGKIEWKIAWVPPPGPGWVVYGVPTGPHATPSKRR